MADDELVFGGRYRVDGPIGSGGMGTVWSGYDQQLDRRVAIKLMHAAATPALRPGSPEALALAEAAATDRERFLREVRTTARLELPGIPAVYDFGVDPATDRLYLVMQLLRGQTLADLIVERDYESDPWPISWAAAIAAQIAATLVEVHHVGVVHRDIKPSNLIVEAGGLVKVLDFGVAVLQGAGALPRLTQVGVTVGSPPYMSPEQVLGNPVGPASDVYALGCVLYEMLTGHVPYAETRVHSYQDRHIHAPIPSPRALRSGVPDVLEALVAAMLAKVPSERPAADEIYESLLPLIQRSPDRPEGERDPRRPFLRPLAPAPRTSRRAVSARHRPPAQPPLSDDEAQEIRSRIAALVEDAHLQQAIDVLEEATARARHDPVLALDMKIDLATTLYVADEFARAAAVLDEILPMLDGIEDISLLRYYAGVSHAELGEIEPAIDYLTAFLSDANHDDPLYRDAAYQLGMMLPAVGRAEEGIAQLTALRPLLVAEYGEESLHVQTLDRRISKIRN